MAEEFIVFSHDPRRDPHGEKFRGLLNAHLAVERACAARAFLAQVVLVVTIALALQLLSPVPFPHWLDVLLHAAWAISLVALGLTSFSEWRLRAERTRCLSALQPPGLQ